MLYTIEEGKEVLLKITQTNTLDERADRAKQCVATLKLSMPTVVDREDNRVNRAYAGWPDRLFIVETDGKLAYVGGPGPKGFQPREVERWLAARGTKEGEKEK